MKRDSLAEQERARYCARGLLAADLVAERAALRIVPTLAAVAGVVLTAFLGSWQLDRAAYKQAPQARADLAEREAPVHRPAEVVTADTLG